jgi:tRNA nucleotidyltransferase (CCA-adding enzyme)
MAKPGAVYPQVEPGAEALMERRLAICPARATVARALARGAGGEVLVTSARAAVRRRELVAAAGWGLGALAADEVAWRGLPVVGPRTAEVTVRRLVAQGAPLVLVRDGRRVVGAVDRERIEVMPPGPSVAGRLERGGDRAGEARAWMLRVAGKVGEGMGLPVFAVGGIVRDLLRDETAGRRFADLDLVVEGDGIAFARRLAEEVGGHLVVHAGFGTASIEGALASGAGEPSASLLGRVDVASSRRERYEAPGALPRVAPAPLVEDLRRRDFSVNAMAISLAPSTFGRLVDPLGGRGDLDARRLRVLHPLSFVEDPTRIFRAARYAARLRFKVHADSLRALRLGVRIAKYPALSGQRLFAELELLAGEPEAPMALKLLLGWKALKLWNIGYRFVPEISRRLPAASRLMAWTRAQGIGVDASELYLVSLLADQRLPVATATLHRLAVSGEPLARLRAALAARPLAARLERESRPSRIADMARAQPMTAIAAAWMLGGARARRRLQWFLSEGRAVRPLLAGEDVVALGVPRGPRVGDCLAELRRRRLDGALVSVGQEREFVKEWLKKDEKGGVR